MVAILAIQQNEILFSASLLCDEEVVQVQVPQYYANCTK
jgi:hypothetical protein